MLCYCEVLEGLMCHRLLNPSDYHEDAVNTLLDLFRM